MSGHFLSIQSYAAAMVAPLESSLYPVTPDGRYFVVRDRLWRMANPALSEQERARLVSELMRARRDIGKALRIQDAQAETLARQAVQVAKDGLGERGPAWWTDGAPDYNRRMVRNTPYARWYLALRSA